MRNTSRRLTALALTAFMLMSVASCGASRSSESEEIRSHSASVETTAEARSVNTAIGDGFYTEGAEVAYDYEYEAASEAAAPENLGGGSSSGSVAVSDPAVTDPSTEASDRMLIRYVSVSCETLRFTELTSGIESQVAALGGYIESKNFYGTGNAGDLRSASYTIRVTSEALDQLVNQIGSTAVITGTNESTEDVTLSYTDMQARVESLRIEQDTLNDLLAQADSLDTILILQNELTNIRYQIESYESQMRVLRNLSSYSTLTLNITEVLEETEPEEPHIKTYSEKISEAWHDGIDKARNTLEDLGLYLAENAIGIGIKIILLVVIIIVVKVIVKKIKKKAAAKKNTPVAPVTPAQAPDTSPAPVSDDPS